MTTRFQEMDKFVAYLEEWNEFSDNFITPKQFVFIKSSVKALKLQIERFQRQYPHIPLKSISHYSTLIIENMFSIIRRKVLYPDIVQLHQCLSRAMAELILRNCPDSPLPMPRTKLGKCYNSQEGIRFAANNIGRILPPPHSAHQKRKLDDSIGAGTPEQQQLCQKLATDYSGIRHKLLIRQATCTANPLQKTSVVKVNLPCPDLNCERHQAPYLYPASLITHLRVAHGYDEAKAKETCKKIEHDSIQVALSLKEKENLGFTLKENTKLDLSGFVRVMLFDCRAAEDGQLSDMHLSALAFSMTWHCASPTTSDLQQFSLVLQAFGPCTIVVCNFDVWQTFDRTSRPNIVHDKLRIVSIELQEDDLYSETMTTTENSTSESTSQALKNYILNRLSV